MSDTVTVDPVALDWALEVFIGTYQVTGYTLGRLLMQIRQEAPDMDTSHVRTMTEALVILAALSRERRGAPLVAAVQFRAGGSPRGARRRCEVWEDGHHWEGILHRTEDAEAANGTEPARAAP